MKAWLLSLLSLALLLVLLELLLSEGKTKKLIAGIVNTLLVVSFLVPLSKLVRLSDETAIYATISVEETAESSTETFARLLSGTVEAEMRKKGVEVTAHTTLAKEKILCIDICVQEMRISENERNIYTIDTIRDEVSHILNIEKEQINVYGYIE